MTIGQNESTGERDDDEAGNIDRVTDAKRGAPETPTELDENDSTAIGPASPSDKNVNQGVSSTTGGKPKYSLRMRLREETEAPFRKARMFIYAGSAASAGVGAFISTLRIISALVGTRGVQPLNETVC